MTLSEERIAELSVAHDRSRPRDKTRFIAYMSDAEIVELCRLALIGKATEGAAVVKIGPDPKSAIDWAIQVKKYKGQRVRIVPCTEEPQ